MFRRKLYKKVENGFKKFDLFGKEVKLNFQDDDEFKTGFGGFFSILFVGLLLFFFWN